MNKQQLIDKLKELGIDTENCYPKKSFIKDLIPVVGMFEKEFQDDFYFYSDYQKKIYKLPKQTQAQFENFEKDVFQGETKRLVPLSICEIIWDDKPFEELPDEQYDKMTVRKYACIHLKVPKSGLPWLDALIKESQNIHVTIGG